MNSLTPQTATLKTIQTGSTKPPQALPCRFGGLQGKSLTLQFDEQPQVSGPVSVEFDDAMFLGEVIRLSTAPNGGWHVEIAVEQVLTGLQNLLRFRSQLLGEGVGPAPERAARPVYACVA